MKNLFKTIMVALFLSMSATAFAQCMTINQPGPPRIWDGQRGCYVPQGTPALGTANSGIVQQQVYNPPYVSQSQYVQPQGYYQNGMPHGNGLSNCSAVGALAGGTLGSLAHNHRSQAVILGALIGGVAGSWMCTNSQGQRVAVQPQVAAAPVVSAEIQVAGVRRGTKTCTRIWSDGRKEKKAVESEAECDDFLARKGETVTGGQAVATQPLVVNQGRQSVCRRTWSDGRVEKKEGLTDTQCDDYQAGKIN